MPEEPVPKVIDPDNPGGYVQKSVPEEAQTVSCIPNESWEAAVRTWVDDHVRNSPLAGATEAWNHLQAVLPRLRQYLESELSK